jgi:hypothetical protein
MNDLDLILNAIHHELQLAEKKHPVWPEDPIHASAIVAEETGELIRASLQLKFEGGKLSPLQTEAIQVAAMAIRFLQNIPNYKI